MVGDDGQTLEKIVEKSTIRLNVFEKSRALNLDDIEQVLSHVVLKIRSFLERSYADKELELEKVVESSIAQVIAFGERAEQPIRRDRDLEDFFWDVRSEGKKPLCVKSAGFSLHAGMRVKSRNRTALERLIKYMARPSIFENQLFWTVDGDIRLQLRKPWSDGTHSLIFSPGELLEKLICLIPRPYKNQVVYGGCFGARSKIRRSILLTYKPKPKSPPTRYTISWAELLKRTFFVDRTICQLCGGKLIILRLVVEQDQIRVY